MTAHRLIEMSAPLARLVSDAVCETMNGNDHCGALHGVWLDLRRLGLAADPDRHGEFFDSALGKRAAAHDSSRVLISGCADWGMLATVAQAYGARDAELAATVVDRCLTPALLCAWYGSRIGLPVRTAVSDLASYRDATPFDVICSHSLLTYAPRQGQRALVANWRELLRPGGAVVTVSRLDVDPEPPAEDPVQRARQFGELVLRRCKEIGMGGDHSELVARAERFAGAQVSHRIGTEADLRALFEDSGFVIESLDVRRLEGMVQGRSSITGAARSNAYAELVAVRR